MRRVVVTGLGAVTPLGVGVKRTWKNLIDGRSGLSSARETLSNEESRVKSVSALGLVQTKTQNNLNGFDPHDYVTPEVSSYHFLRDTKPSAKERRTLAKFILYAIAATQEAINDCRWVSTKSSDHDRFGVCIGSGIGNFEDMYNTSIGFQKEGFRKVGPRFVPNQLINMAAGQVSIRHDLRGPNTSPSTACTTGAHAIGDAARFIAFGDADMMVAGATESCIHPMSLAGFLRTRSLATGWSDFPERASRPFDRQRNGFVMGEGAGIVVLEELNHALRRDAPIYGELLGYGTSADAHHVTTPPESGYGAVQAMRLALRNAGVHPAQVDYINAHATGTSIGDSVENKAIQDVMLGRDPTTAELLQAEGDREKKFKNTTESICVSSTKGAIGHLLGAAGSVEAIFTILALKEGILPPTSNLENPGDARGEQSPERDASTSSTNWSCDYIHQIARRKADAKIALSNSFGFGGTNATLCFGKWEGKVGSV